MPRFQYTSFALSILNLLAEILEYFYPSQCKYTFTNNKCFSSHMLYASAAILDLRVSAVIYMYERQFLITKIEVYESIQD